MRRVGVVVAMFGLVVNRGSQSVRGETTTWSAAYLTASALSLLAVGLREVFVRSTLGKPGVPWLLDFGCRHAEGTGRLA